MKCDPKKMTGASLEVAAWIVYLAIARCRDFEQQAILCNGPFTDILDEDDLREEVGW